MYLLLLHITIGSKGFSYASHNSDHAVMWWRGIVTEKRLELLLLAGFFTDRLIFSEAAGGSVSQTHVDSFVSFCFMQLLNKLRWNEGGVQHTCETGAWRGVGQNVDTSIYRHPDRYDYLDNFGHYNCDVIFHTVTSLVVRKYKMCMEGRTPAARDMGRVWWRAVLTLATFADVSSINQAEHFCGSGLSECRYIPLTTHYQQRREDVTLANSTMERRLMYPIFISFFVHFSWLK